MKGKDSWSREYPHCCTGNTSDIGTGTEKTDCGPWAEKCVRMRMIYDESGRILAYSKMDNRLVHPAYTTGYVLFPGPKEQNFVFFI